jgi:hypothetical protein
MAKKVKTPKYDDANDIYGSTGRLAWFKDNYLEFPITASTASNKKNFVVAAGPRIFNYPLTVATENACIGNKNVLSREVIFKTLGALAYLPAFASRLHLEAISKQKEWSEYSLADTLYSYFAELLPSSTIFERRGFKTAEFPRLIIEEAEQSIDGLVLQPGENMVPLKSYIIAGSPIPKSRNGKPGQTIPLMQNIFARVDAYKSLQNSPLANPLALTVRYGAAEWHAKMVALNYPNSSNQAPEDCFILEDYVDVLAHAAGASILAGLTIPQNPELNMAPINFMCALSGI